MQISDTKLMHRWIDSSNEEAFAEIIKRHGNMVYATCLRVLGNTTEAEDITQDCFTKLATLEKVKGDTIGGLLHKMATRLSLNRLRDLSRRRKHEQNFSHINTDSHTKNVDDIFAAIDEVITGLPPKFREVLVSHFLEGENFQSLAASLGIDESTVRYRTKTGVEKVRKALVRRGIKSASASLWITLDALNNVTDMPTTLTENLGKLAVAGRSTLVASQSSVAVVKSLVLLGGYTLTLKKAAVIALLIAGMFAATFSVQQYVTNDLGRIPIISTRKERGRNINRLRKATTAATMTNTQTRPPSNSLGNDNNQGTTNKSVAISGKSLYSSDIPTDNAIHYFLLAAELLPSAKARALQDKWTQLKTKEIPDSDEFQALLGRLQESIDKIRLGIEVGNAALPLPTSTAWDMSHLSGFRDLARVLSVQAQYLAANGYYAAAFEDYSTLLGFTIESTREGVLTAALVGMALRNIAYDSLEETLSWGGATGQEYQAFIGYVCNAEKHLSSAFELLDGERKFLQFLNNDKNMPEQDGNSDDKTPQRNLDMFDDYLKLPYYEAQIIGLKNTGDDTNNTAFPVELIENYFSGATKDHARLRGILLMAGIQFYRAENNQCPESLEILVPQYLPYLPKDPFSGNSFTYARLGEDYKLYSAGPDMDDDGGKPYIPEAREGNDGDLVIHNGDQIYLPFFRRH